MSPQLVELSSDGSMEKSIVDTVYEVLRTPGEGMREVVRGEPLGWAVLIIVIASALWILSLYLGSFDVVRGVHGNIATGTCLWVGISVVGMFAIAGIFHMGAKLLRGQGSYRGLVCGLGFATLPLTVIPPLTVLHVLLGFAGFVLYVLGAAAISIWVLVLEIIAIRENYSFSRKKAILTYFSPVIAIVLIQLVTIVVSSVF